MENPEHAIVDFVKGQANSKKSFGESQFYINDVSHIKSFAKFTGKHLRQSLFFNKIKGLRHATFLPKRLRIFLLILQIFCKYLFYRTPTVHASFTLTKFEGM